MVTFIRAIRNLFAGVYSVTVPVTQMGCLVNSSKVVITEASPMMYNFPI